MEELFNVSWLLVLIMFSSMLAITLGTPKLFLRFEKLDELLNGRLYFDINTAGVSVVSLISLIAIIILPVTALLTLNSTILASFIVSYFLWVVTLGVSFSIEEKLSTY